MGHELEAGGTSTGRALVVYPHLKTPPSERAGAVRAPEGRLAEAVGLAEAIQLDVVHAEVVNLNQPRPATLIGKGGVERLHDLIEELEIGVVVVDAAVSPVQQRNLEQAWQCKVIDRTGLILEIFGARARTHEGRRSNSPPLRSSARASCGPGPIWSGSAAALASWAAPAKARSNSTAA
jgi:GTP-binding protein HflX